MKEIVILLEEKTWDYEVGRFIEYNLREVLGNTVNIQICFLADVGKVNFSFVDLILVMVDKLLHEIYTYIHGYCSTEKILLVSRTLSRSALAEINGIPPGEVVLVINRTPDTTAAMIRLLYELEVIHLNFVAYGSDVKAEDFGYIIITGTPDLLPNCKAKVINVGYRQIGTQTFLDIFSRLGIRNDELTRNLIRYIQKLPPKYDDVGKRYLLSQVTDKILQKVVEKSDFGILVTDMKHLVLYCNQKANEVFRTEIRENEPLELPGGQNIVKRLFSADFHNELIKIGEEYIMVERHLLANEGDAVGFYFECQTAKSITDMGSRLSEKLRKSGLYAKYKFDDIVYRSMEMNKCLEIAKKLARTNYSILISGESGSGKEMFAQSIHNASERFAGPFIAVNCAAFPESLLESELFGYEGGAFTGSKQEGRAGLFELANKGSIFLDEIGDMPLSLQAKLLRVLQEKKIMRVGSSNVIDIDIRVLSASNKYLKEEIDQNRFRADLYYRLSTFTISIPPLRSRRDDILPLFYTFISKEHRKLTEDEKKLLTDYYWPGNVRELQNIAAYFDVIGSIDSVPNVRASQELISSVEAKAKIMDVLYRYRDIGLGRGRIISLLKGEGIILSEKRFEGLINELLQENAVSRGKGRKGIRLNTNWEL